LLKQQNDTAKREPTGERCMISDTSSALSSRHCIHCRVHQKHNADGDEASAACAAAHASFSGGILADGIDLRDMNRKRKARLTPQK
jgi:hypothetical protein